MTPSVSPQPEERDGTETRIEWGVRWNDPDRPDRPVWTDTERIARSIIAHQDEGSPAVLVQRTVTHGPWSEVPS
jgi:hypothetical protein